MSAAHSNLACDRSPILLTFNQKREPPQVVIEMLRTVMAGARTYPDLGRSLNRAGPGQVALLVREELSRAAEAGKVALEPKEIPAAEELPVDMVVGNAIPALLDPDRILRNPEEQAARRDRALGILLNGVRPRTTFG